MKTIYLQIAKALQQKEYIIPQSVDFDAFGNACSQDCFYCNTADYRAAVPVKNSYEEYIKLLHDIKDWRKDVYAANPDLVVSGQVNTICLTGGAEPTIYDGYEKVLAKSVEMGFVTAMITNGHRLDTLYENISHDITRQMAWIGVDIDSGIPETYEKIRKTLSKESLFETVRANIKNLTSIGARVDLKVLLCEFNTSEIEIDELFRFAKETKARGLHIRPVVLNGTCFVVTDAIKQFCENSSKKYDVKYKLVLGRLAERNYIRCHSIFNFPTFCADGNITVCCEGKGDPRFSLGTWKTGDWRDLWMSSRHYDIYKSINAKLCQPCRPNVHNIEIQNCLNDPDSMELLIF